MKKYYYQVKKIELNVWHKDGSPVFVWDCGHKHRTLTGAIRCLHQWDGTPRSIGLDVYRCNDDGDEKVDGVF